MANISKITPLGSSTTYDVAAWRLKNYNRLTNANIAHITDGGMELFQATATMTDNKPAGNGQILHFHWDTNEGWDSQVYIPNGHGGSMQWRAHTSATDWGAAWKTLVDSSNIGTYTTVSNTWTAGTTAGPTIKTTVNGVAGTAVAIPSASASASGVVTTGAQTFAGIKTFTSPETINTTGNGAQVNFKFSDAASANGIYGQNWITYENTSGRFYWREWSGSSSGRTSYFEQYRLPACNASRTSNATYNIITTKNPADLGYYLPLSGGQMTGPLTWKDGNALPEFSGNPPFLLGIESFANGGTTKWKTISSITVGGATKDGDGNTISSTYLKLSGGQMTGAIGFGASSMNRAILYYNSSYPKYGIWYNDTTVDKMRFSASGNADTDAGADLCINGNGDGTVTIRGKTILHTGNYSTTCDTRYVKKAGDTMTGHLTAPSTACSWLTGQNAANAAFNVGNATDTGSYWPWLRQTNTSSAKWFSFGTLNTSFYWIGSATSRTGNGYDYGMQFNVANGYLQGCSRVYGAVWNDYAEYRKDNPKENQEPGRCVKELGDGSLALTTKRLERGCEIISDTFGFAIGQDEENGYNTPIASNGRVLAYPYESIEEFTTHIGWPVCSGPNGTVSIMTEEEEEKYPSRIIGTISEIPNYDTWGTGNVKVNGRIWIRIR